MKTLRLLPQIFLSAVILMTAMVPVRATAEPRSRWSTFCEGLFEKTGRIKNTVTGVAGDVTHRLWLAFLGLIPGGADWFDEFDFARVKSNRFLHSYHERDWRDPVRVAHVVSRLPRQAKVLLNMFRREERRAQFNRETLDWEFEYLREERPHMRRYLETSPPKYIAMTLDDHQINTIVARDFPDFVSRPELRAVEIAVAPAFLFGADQFLPRIYRRFTLVILRDGIVIKAYPTLELNLPADAIATPAVF